MHQTDSLGFSAVHHLAEHHACERGLRADDPAQHPRVPAARVDADLQEAGVEARPPRSEAQVTSEREVHPGTHGCAVDGGDGGQRRTGDAKESFVDRAEAPGGGLGEVAQVRSGTERRRRARHHDRSHALVRFELVHRSDDLGHQGRRQRVPLRRVVQGERGDDGTVAGVTRSVHGGEVDQHE